MKTHDNQLLDYVLGLLEPDGLAALEVELRSDPIRQAEVRALRESLLSLTDDLPSAVPPEATLPLLMDRFRALRALRAEEAQVADSSGRPASLQAPKTPSRSSRRTLPRSNPRPGSFLPRSTLFALSGLAIIASLVLGAFLLRGGNLFAVPQPLLTAYLNDPSVRKLELKNSDGQPTGQVLLRPDGRALISMKSALPPGKVFQAWGVNGPAEKRVATAIGQSDGNQLEVNLRGYPILWISIEPAGGSPSPTRKVGRVKVG